MYTKRLQCYCSYDTVPLRTGQVRLTFCKIRSNRDKKRFITKLLRHFKTYCYKCISPSFYGLLCTGAIKTRYQRKYGQQPLWQPVLVILKEPCLCGGQKFTSSNWHRLYYNRITKKTHGSVSKKHHLITSSITFCFKERGRGLCLDVYLAPNSQLWVCAVC